MKKTEIIKTLKANKNINGFELICTNKDSRELFYVLDHLEINRAVNTIKQVATVYVNSKDKTGTSTVTITAADDVKSLNKKINEASKKAKAAYNAYYPLATKSKNIKDIKKNNYDLNDIACNVAKAVFKADTYSKGWLNSTEIFVTNFTREFDNSNNVHHIENGFEIKIEVIPTWKGEKEEVELYKFYESGKIDYKQITAEIKQLLINAKLRSEAKTLNDVKVDQDTLVLVQNDMLDSILDNLCANASYQYNFLKMNHYNLKDVVSNNPFTLTAKGKVKGCNKSMSFDGNGVVLKSKTLIKDGKLVNNFGSLRFGYYLNQKNITGSLPVAVLDGKRSSYKKKKHLIIENFSSPQLDESTGYWGGEVRLARYFDGKKYIPLTGFSISGNIYEDIKEVEFSKEDCTMPSYSGPKYFIFKGIQIH